MAAALNTIEIECPRCYGDGYINHIYTQAFGALDRGGIMFVPTHSEELKCDDCKGTGRVQWPPK